MGDDPQSVFCADLDKDGDPEIITGNRDSYDISILFNLSVKYLRGDANYDQKVTLADIVYLVAYLYKGGPPPSPIQEVGDANCDGKVSLSDIVYLVAYLFKHGPQPCFSKRI